MKRKTCITHYVQVAAPGAGVTAAVTFQAPTDGFLTHWAGSIAMQDIGDQTFGTAWLSRVNYAAVTDISTALTPSTILAVVFINMAANAAASGLAVRQSNFSVPLSYFLPKGTLVYALVGGSTTPSLYGVIQFVPD